MGHEYLVIKLGYIKGIDFYEEHIKVIEECGYVDVARVGKRFLNFLSLNEPYFYIKESLKGGNRIFKAYIVKELSGKRCVPDYYSTLDLTHASWVRINKLEVIDRNKFLDEHTLKNGKEIKALNQGAVPFFYVIKAKKN